MKNLRNYCYDQENPDDYFQDLYQESYVQNFQALKFCKTLEKTSMEKVLEK